MILSVQNIEKSYPSQTLFKDASFLLEDQEKAAIVGINGAGKTTLLRMITGNERPDGGTVTFSKDITWGYLAQENDEDTPLTIYELMLSKKKDLVELEEKLSTLQKQMHALQEQGDENSPELLSLIDQYSKMQTTFEHMDGYSYKSLLTGMLKGLGFSEADFDKKVNTLSGGQKTRAHLASLLYQSPDLIILDEPTNHLDIAAIEWLESFLKNYKGAVLLISHDRYFLDNIVTKVIAIEEKGLRTYRGNYTEYAKKAAMLYEAKLAAYYKQSAEIAHQEDVIRKLKSFNREKSIKRAESREKMLDKMERLEKPEVLKDKMHLALHPDSESGKDVLMAEELSKSFGENHLFSGISFMIRKGEHVAMIGNNGTGKTTMLKILTGLLDPDSGTCTLGTGVKIGYYDQEHHELSAEKTLFDEISDTYPTLDQTKIRNTLAAFLFTGDDVQKKISALSGGEKGRLSLAKLMLSGANFLILDEPTNHLDIASKEILEQAIRNYDGTLLYVSHDRYFVNQTAHRILDLSGRALYDFPGNYDYYLEKKETVESAGSSAKSLFAGNDPAAGDDSSDAKTQGSATDGKTDWQMQKQLEAARRKQENELKKCETQIEELETRQEEINTQLSDPKNGTDLPLLQKLAKEQDEINEKLSVLYETWDTLAEG
ncbi:MAG: ABC-F type ribosomal protection protein [Lachnospiraceae bacterium]|nr:ABC-F type ribosomal protection protein [Lachnospiraceae bacterium]